MTALYQTRINLHHPRYSPVSREEERALLQSAQAGNARARARLIQANLRFVTQVARRLVQPPFTIDEMIDEGVVGLDEAITRMDTSRGIKFISYAVWWIRAEIRKAINETGSTIRVPAYHSLKLSPARMEAGAQAKACRPMSHILDSDAGYLRSNDNPSQQAEENSFTRFMDACNRSLTLRERDILWRNAGWSNGTFVERTSMGDIAKDWGLTETRVQQIRRQAIEKLREAGLFSEMI